MVVGVVADLCHIDPLETLVRDEGHQNDVWLPTIVREVQVQH